MKYSERTHKCSESSTGLWGRLERVQEQDGHSARGETPPPATTSPQRHPRVPSAALLTHLYHDIDNKHQQYFFVLIQWEEHVWKIYTLTHQMQRSGNFYGYYSSLVCWISFQQATAFPGFTTNVAEDWKPLIASIASILLWKNHPYSKTHAETRSFTAQTNLSYKEMGWGGGNFSNYAHQPPSHLSIPIARTFEMQLCSPTYHQTARAFGKLCRN